jgi:FMNH2-dependent dimethyl sulfone monooxygenase
MPADPPPCMRRISLGTTNRLKLGLFGANMSSGFALTTVPERWTADWSENVEVAQMADAAGLDFLLPVARWKGYGGEVDPAGVSHETIAWACGLLAKTQRIHVFATVHTTLVNPVFAAKQFVTVDHIGEGRLGINVVVGWNQAEFEMFGVEAAADTRYPYTREWLDCVKRLWSSDAEFDYAGQFLQLRGLKGKPAPFGGDRPLILNAGMSSVGQAFAIACCDGLFSTPPGGDYAEFAKIIADVKQRAAPRNYPVFTSTMIICRATAREAEEFYHYCQENADWTAVDNMLALRERSGKVVPQGDLQQRRLGMLRGLGEFRLVGDPDHVADHLARLSAVGVDGVAMSFVNQLRDLPFFLEEVEPRLKRMNLRG